MRYLNWPFKIFLCVIEILTWSFRASVKHHSITPFALSLWIRCQQLSTEYTIIKVWYTSRWVIMNEAIVRKSIVNRLARVTCIAWCVKIHPTRMCSVSGTRRFPFNQKFGKFRNGDKWLGIPSKVVLSVSGNSKKRCCSICHGIFPEIFHRMESTSSQKTNKNSAGWKVKWVIQQTGSYEEPHTCISWGDGHYKLRRGRHTLGHMYCLMHQNSSYKSRKCLVSGTISVQTKTALARWYE